LRVVFSQTKKITVIAFSDANTSDFDDATQCFKSDGSGSHRLTP